MVEADLNAPEIQSALTPGGSGLNLLTSVEGVSTETIQRDADRWIGVITRASEVLAQLPEPIVETALVENQIPAEQRTSVLSVVQDTSVLLTKRRLGLAEETPSRSDTAVSESAAEDPMARNERVLHHRFNDSERQKNDEILAQHRAKTAPRAGHVAIAAA